MRSVGGARAPRGRYAARVPWPTRTPLSDIIDVTVTLQQADISRDGSRGSCSFRAFRHVGPGGDPPARRRDPSRRCSTPATWSRTRRKHGARGPNQRPNLATVKIGRKDAGRRDWASAHRDPRGGLDWCGLACDTRDAGDIETIPRGERRALHAIHGADARRRRPHRRLRQPRGNARRPVSRPATRAGLRSLARPTASAADFPGSGSGTQPFALDNGQVLNIEVNGGAARGVHVRRDGGTSSATRPRPTQSRTGGTFDLGRRRRGS